MKKFFLEMTPLGVKTCGESEFDIFEAKKRFPDSGKACVLKRKVAKMRFLPKNGVKMCGKEKALFLDQNMLFSRIFASIYSFF